jgi:Mn-dependent DtxR family transcriptional regulator
MTRRSGPTLPVLVEILRGRATSIDLALRLDRHPKTIRDTLRRLERYGLAKIVGTGKPTKPSGNRPLLWAVGETITKRDHE